MKKAAQFKPFIFCSFITLAMFLTSPALFSQVVLDGNVTDNGAEYLGSGAEPVEGALVSLTEISSGESQTVHTDENGYYSFEITLTGIHEDDFARASAFKVLQNYPNPFNPSTVIPFQIQRPAHITLEVYNVLGRKVKTLIDGYQSASGYVPWDATDDFGRGVPAGVYIYTLQAEDMRFSRKMLLLDGHQASASAAVSAIEEPVLTAAPVTHKTASNQFTITVEGGDIEGYEEDIEITGNMTLPITVNRTMTGNDGRIYRTVKIGDQLWMAENLRETQYRSGDAIPEVTDHTAWSELSTGARSVYENDEDNAEIYGYLYNWYAVGDTGNIAPEGWRVPTDDDWTALVHFLGDSSAAGGKMKTTGTTHWLSPNTGATNESGFSALSAGWRDHSNGGFLWMSYYAGFWSASEYDADYAWHRSLRYNYSDMFSSYYYKRSGFVVRLIRIEDPDLHTVSTPNAPSCPDTGEIDEDLEFNASGSSCSEDHEVEYRFDWGDDTFSDWEDSTQNNSYSSAGTYGIRAQARCAEDTTVVSDWSNAWTITISAAFETGTMTGNDGRVYRTVKIGDQWWMAENLRETQYRSGDAIPEVTGNSAWSELSAGARCVYDNDVNNADTYGYLYNWYAVDDAGNIAPEGWRVPTDDDWKKLEMHLGMSESDANLDGRRGSVEGSKLAGNADLWDSGALKNHAEFGTSGYNALPAGYRASGGPFGTLGGSTFFWSATEYASGNAWVRGLDYYYSDMGRYGGNRQGGFSVRLLKD